MWRYRFAPTFRSASGLLARTWAAWAVCAMCLFAGACRSDGGGHVPDSTMVEVLAELHLLDARAQVAAPVRAEARDSIFSRYGIDSVSFARTAAYYADHPDEYADLYGRVVDRLTAEGESVRLPDSLRAPGAPTPPSR